MSDSSSIATLLQAVERYFALMHDNDVSRDVGSALNRHQAKPRGLGV